MCVQARAHVEHRCHTKPKKRNLFGKPQATTHTPLYSGPLSRPIACCEAAAGTRHSLTRRHQWRCIALAFPTSWAPDPVTPRSGLASAGMGEGGRLLGVRPHTHRAGGQRANEENQNTSLFLPV